MELAKEFGISKTAILEHLRKAERKIMLRVGIS
jgi:predicted DNA binding protein